MLSFEERLKLLQGELETLTSEEVLSELQSYEAKGPLASEFFNYIPLLKINSSMEVVDLNTPEHAIVGFITLVDESYYFTPKTSGECVTEAFNAMYGEQIKNILKEMNNG